MRAWFALGAFLVATACAGGVTHGTSFQDAPPTMSLFRLTAYILRGGEWQISLPSILAPLEVSVEYGITDNLQIGTVPIMLVFGQVFAGGKLRLGFGRGLDLAIPFVVGYYADPVGFAWSTGVVVSAQAGRALTLHGGVIVGAMHMQQVYVSTYATIDLGLSPNLKLVGEVGLLPLSGGAGILARLFGFLEIRVGLMVPLWFQAGLAARF